MGDGKRREAGSTVPETHRSALVLVPQSDGRDVVVLALRKEGFRVEVARNPFDAYSLFVRDPVKLVVVSLGLLRSQDRQLLRELQRISPDLRMLLLVPEGRRGEVGRFLQAGGDSVLASPCTTAEIRYVARALLRSDSADALTGLPNRAAYRRVFEREKERANRDGGTLGLGLIDLDDFRSANTDHGYRLADQVLQEAARRIREVFRVMDIVARWGGEEFTVLLTGLPEDEAEARTQAITAVDRARERMEVEPILIVGTADRVERAQTLSAGLALYPHDGVEFQDVFDLANKRLKLAKSIQGKNRVVGS